MLKNICSTLFPSLYAERLIECAEEKKSWSSTLPIFYFNECQFPGYNLDLNLFEPRYKHMMQRIVNSTRKFAYVANFTNYTAKVGDVALVANLSEAQFLPDGCVIIRAKLTERKKIIEHYGKFNSSFFLFMISNRSNNSYYYYYYYYYYFYISKYFFLSFIYYYYYVFL